MAFSEKTTIAHTPEQIFTALTSREFHQRVTDKVGAELASFEVSHDVQDRVKVVMVRSIDSQQLSGRVPDFAQKLLGNGLTVEQEEIWEAPDAQGNRRGTMKVNIPVVRATATATQSLISEPGEQNTTYELAGEAQCKIPLVGSRIVEVAEPQVSKIVRRQSQELASWLNEQA